MLEVVTFVAGFQNVADRPGGKTWNNNAYYGARTIHCIYVISELVHEVMILMHNLNVCDSDLPKS